MNGPDQRAAGAATARRETCDSRPPVAWLARAEAAGAALEARIAAGERQTAVWPRPKDHAS